MWRVKFLCCFVSWLYYNYFMFIFSESTPEGRRVTKLDKLLLNGNNITMVTRFTDCSCVFKGQSTHRQPPWVVMPRLHKSSPFQGSYPWQPTETTARSCLSYFWPTNKKFHNLFFEGLSKLQQISFIEMCIYFSLA